MNWKHRVVSEDWSTGGLKSIVEKPNILIKNNFKLVKNCKKWRFNCISVDIDKWKIDLCTSLQLQNYMYMYITWTHNIKLRTKYKRTTRNVQKKPKGRSKQQCKS